MSDTATRSEEIKQEIDKEMAEVRLRMGEMKKIKAEFTALVGFPVVGPLLGMMKKKKITQQMTALQDEVTARRATIKKLQAEQTALAG